MGLTTAIRTVIVRFTSTSMESKPLMWTLTLTPRYLPALLRCYMVRWAQSHDQSGVNSISIDNTIIQCCHDILSILSWINYTIYCLSDSVFPISGASCFFVLFDFNNGRLVHYFFTVHVYEYMMWIISWRFRWRCKICIFQFDMLLSIYKIEIYVDISCSIYIGAFYHSFVSDSSFDVL